MNEFNKSVSSTFHFNNHTLQKEYLTLHSLHPPFIPLNERTIDNDFPIIKIGKFPIYVHRTEPAERNSLLAAVRTKYLYTRITFIYYTRKIPFFYV